MRSCFSVCKTRVSHVHPACYSRELGYMVKAIMDFLPTPAPQLIDEHSTQPYEPPPPLPAAPFTSIKIVIREPNNVNTSAGTFVYNDGPGNIQRNSGAGRLYDLTRPDISAHDIFQCPPVGINPWLCDSHLYTCYHLLLSQTFVVLSDGFFFFRSLYSYTRSALHLHLH
ncbi:hypothetical protein HGRIS_001050 [Hohenbuehelia grisea]|uniref:Uncharacterized protein n=1 Tax=Hohenbuehelia grisea TaxID=104357 RepID=A0ABR3JQA0_9AGAR